MGSGKSLIVGGTKNGGTPLYVKGEEKLALSKARHLLVLGDGKYLHLGWKARAA